MASKRSSVFAAILAMTLVAGALSAQGKVTLRLAWWGNPTRDARTMQVVELYMKLHPEVTIETETTGWAGYWDKLGSQAAARNLPDIIQQDYSYITQYAQKDLLLDLGPYVQAKKIDLSGVPDTFTSGGKVDGKLYGVSLGTNAFCFLLDSAALQKAGLEPPKPSWTMADFEKMANAIYAKTGVQTPVFSSTDPKVMFNDWLRQNKQTFFNVADGSSLGFSDTKLLVEFYESQLRMLKSKAMTPPDVSFGQTTPDESRLTKGQEWNLAVWSNQVVSTQAPMKRPVLITLLPRIADSKQPGTFLKPSMFFSVTKGSENKEEAVKFVNFFMNDLEANKILLAERGIPIVQKVRDSLKAMVDPLNKQIFEFIDLVGNKNSSPIDPADPAGAGEVLKVFRTVDQEVLFGQTAPQAGAEKFIKQANDILAKNKK
jgi:multiple sugar transport system substrate-binding protein